MKAYIFLLLYCLGIFYNLNAQTDIAGREQYDSYKQCIYIDNLDQRLISEIFNDTYYFKLKGCEFDVDSQIIDTTNRTRYIYIHTKKAKDGYSFVNREVMDKIKELNCDLNKQKVLYVYNGEIVWSKDKVNRILRLKAKNIRISDILQDKKLGIISVYISDHKS